MTDILDTFTGPVGALVDHVADTGEMWTMRPTFPYNPDGSPQAQVPSVIDLDGSGNVWGPNGSYAHLATIGPATSDVEASIAFNADGIPTYTGVGIVLRWTAPGDFVLAYVYNAETFSPPGRYVVIEEYTGGVQATENSDYQPASGEHVLGVSVVDDFLRVFYDSVQVLSHLLVSTPHVGGTGILCYYHGMNVLRRFGVASIARGIQLGALAI